MHWFLESVIMDRLDALDSLIYKNAWQLMKLFRTYSLVMEYEAGDTERLDLPYMIHISDMISYVTTHYDEEEGQGEYRLSLILMMAKRVSKSGHRTEDWQRELALDQDIYQLIFRAIGAQVNEIARFERSLLSLYQIVKDSGKVSRETTSILNQIFILYESILVSAMGGGGAAHGLL